MENIELQVLSQQSNLSNIANSNSCYSLKAVNDSGSRIESGKDLGGEDAETLNNKRGRESDDAMKPSPKTQKVENNENSLNGKISLQICNQIEHLIFRDNC